MGANKNSDRRKCGEILINIKTIKNKAKMFTFHCALCSLDCDQLKKFSKHLENHSHYFENDYDDAMDEAKDQISVFDAEEIKVDDLEQIVKGECKFASSALNLEEHEDPLETEKTYKNHLKQICNTEGLRTTNIKTEDDDGNKVACDSSLTLKNCSSDDLSDYSSDSDFDVEKELKTKKDAKLSGDIKTNSDISERRKMSQKETMNNSPNKASNNNKPKRRRRVIIDKIIPILIQQYQKHKILWQVDDIAYGVKNKKYEIYGKMAEVLRSEANEIISLEDINYHINYLNELYSKDKEQEMKCKMEKKEFLPEFEHYENMSFLNTSQGPFLCEICNEILPKYHAYCLHIAQHNDTLPFKCSSCEMMFTNYHKYLIHKKRHLGIHDYHCNICGKGYLFKNDLEWHVTSHTGDKPYLCQICGTGFRARHGYDNHIRRHEERFRYECHICKKGFNQLHALNNHVKSHLNIRDVICEICGKGFVHTKYLKRHELIHGKEKRYKCNECGKAFFQACGLRAHRKNHHS